MIDIALIACCKSKKDTTVPIPASELYTGTLFKSQLAYTRQVLKLKDNHIFVLSAKYGLVNITTPVSSYEETLIGKSRSHKLVWSCLVGRCLMRRLGAGVETVWLMAGKAYREPLLHWGCRLELCFPKLKITIPHPSHYGIGQQVRWYQQQLKGDVCTS